MKYMVKYQKHDKGAKDGSMIRENKERAEKSIQLMKECGYKIAYAIPVYWAENMKKYVCVPN